MSFLGRFLRRLTQTDEQRMAEETREWAGKIPGATSIAETPNRAPARVAGIVRKIVVWPREGDEAEYLEALVSDGTGEINAQWTGRLSIPGLSLGTKLVVEGVLRGGKDRELRTMANPKFEFVS